MNTTHYDHLPNTQDLSGTNSPNRPQGGYQGMQRKVTAFGRPLKTALLMVALIGGFYLLHEHWGHVAGNWIYLLLACPLMHLFHGHGGHGRHGGHPAPNTKPANKED